MLLAAWIKRKEKTKKGNRFHIQLTLWFQAKVNIGTSNLLFIPDQKANWTGKTLYHCNPQTHMLLSTQSKIFSAHTDYELKNYILSQSPYQNAFLPTAANAVCWRLTCVNHSQNTDQLSVQTHTVYKRNKSKQTPKEIKCSTYHRIISELNVLWVTNGTVDKV